MDYISMSALRLVWDQLLPLLLSYDIMCQWIINLFERLAREDFPSHLRINIPQGDIKYAIPKYHFNGHGQLNHSQYSLNLKPGSGRMDGEEIERTWGRNNATAASTREMGPGSRHDTLEDHFGWHNFRKMVGLGTLQNGLIKELALI